ncbi:hypothetical protein [Peribacillus asahii]|uniref:hypothetical protein n=1 Tax=Peribacillus asahii TaxID=228899 RepID=UPI00380BC6C4
MMNCFIDLEHFVDSIKNQLGSFFLPVIMPLLFPVIKPILYITFPLMAMINIWVIALLIRKPEKAEVESLLFIEGMESNLIF